MRALFVAALAAALAAGAAPGIAIAAPIWSGNHSVLIQTVNGVSTVIVDGEQLYGDDAQPYIDAARRHR